MLIIYNYCMLRWQLFDVVGVYLQEMHMPDIPPATREYIHINL